MTPSPDPGAILRDLLAQPVRRATWASWVSAQGGFPRVQAALLATLSADPALALRAARRIVRLTPERDPDRGRALRLRAHGWRATGRIDRAAADYEAAAAVFRRRGEPDEEARTAIGWVQVLAVQGRRNRAAKLADRVRPALERVDPTASARLDTNLANAFLHAGEVDRAEPLYRRAHRRFVARSRPAEAAHAAFGLARLHLRAGRPAPARRWLERAREGLADAPPVLAAYVDATAGAIDLADTPDAATLTELTAIPARLDSLRDRRSALEIRLHLTRVLQALGSRGAARRMAEDAVVDARRLGSPADQARAHLLAARTLTPDGPRPEIDAHLTAAREGSEGPLAQRVALEQASWRLGDGDPEALNQLERLQGSLDRVDRGAASLCRMRRAEGRLARGQTAAAVALLTRARRDAQRTPERSARPRMALLLARAADQRDDARGAVRWAQKAVAELEQELLGWHASPLRRDGAESRDHLHSEAVDLVLRHGGRNAVEKAVDLVAQARSPRLLEDLLARLPQGERRSAARRLTALQDLQDPDDGTRAATAVVSPVPRLDPTASRSPAILRRAWRLRHLAAWRRRLGERVMVLYHRSPSGWRAFVVPGEGPLRWVDLPDVEVVLRRTWKPFRLLLETAARLPRARREEFLARTRAEADTALAELRAALWTPLGVEDAHRVLVPDGPLHDLPLEAIALDGTCRSVSRLPHPALLRSVRRHRRPGALLLHGPGDGQRAEVETLAARFRKDGFRVRISPRRDALRRADKALGVVHLAAHGIFRQGDPHLSAVHLDDGWMGFSHLRTPRLRGALVVFSSCESGLLAHHPGRDMEGWLSAGFALGAREMVLTLWKIDDAASQAFTGRFYEAWTAGSTASEAAVVAARAHRATGAHPYRWAAHFAAG